MLTVPGRKVKYFERKNTSRTSCSVKISGLRMTKHLRYFVYSDYFGFVCCKILYEDSEYFGLVYSGKLQVDTVDTPCISSISWLCTAGTPRTGPIFVCWFCEYSEYSEYAQYARSKRYKSRICEPVR